VRGGRLDGAGVRRLVATFECSLGQGARLGDLLDGIGIPLGKGPRLRSDCCNAGCLLWSAAKHGRPNRYLHLVPHLLTTFGYGSTPRWPRVPLAQ